MTASADFREVSLLARQFYDRILRGEKMADVLHHLCQYPPYISQAIAVRMSRIASAPLATAMIDSLVAMYEKANRVCEDCGRHASDGHALNCQYHHRNDEEEGP